MTEDDQLKLPVNRADPAPAALICMEMFRKRSQRVELFMWALLIENVPPSKPHDTGEIFKRSSDGRNTPDLD